MDEYTNCHVISKGMMLLKKATRGISKGKWNAPGGRIEDNETPEHCAVREVVEETSLDVSRLFYHGLLNFHIADGRSYRVHVLSTGTFSGTPQSGEEGEVRWFGVDQIPYNEMWSDTVYWIGRMLNGERFEGEFYFDADGKVAKHRISGI